MANPNRFMQQQTVTVGAGDSPFLSSNPRRRGLIISCPATGTVWLSFGGAAVSGAGLALYAAGPPVVLDQELIGNAFQEEIRAIGSVGGQGINVIEISQG